jgi:gamma-glutamyltranspeptidase/glutathione hydrolase
MRQPALAGALRRLSAAGFEDFYHGEIAACIAADMERHGGYIRGDDLREYCEVTETSPLEGKFGNLRAATFGPPGGGKALLQMFEVFGEAGGDGFDPDSPEGVVLLAEIIRQARLDRRFVFPGGGPDGSQTERRRPPGEGPGGGTSRRMASTGAEGETSHITVADADGNWVSMTQSLERSFGSASLCPELGFLYNGYMRTFKLRTPGHPHFLRPGAPARSNAAPTLLFQDGKPWAAIGNTGSERLASGILQVLLRLRRQTPFRAVLAPRLHCTPEGVVLLEAERFPATSINALTANGYELQPLDAFSFKVGGLQLIVRQGDTLCGVAEPRRDGAAGGPAAVTG